MKESEGKLWMATFGDVTKDIRQRMHATLEVVPARNKIMVSLGGNRWISNCTTLL